MHPAVLDAYNALNGVKASFSSNIPTDQTLNQIWGWNMPSITKPEIIKNIEDTQARLEHVPESANGADLTAALATTPARIQWFMQNVMVNIAGGNAVWVILQLKDELSRLDQIANDFTPAPIAPTPDWRKLAETGYLPRKIADRFTAMEKRLDQLVPKFDDFEQKIKVIENGFEVADQLPETLSSLNDAKSSLKSMQSEASSSVADAATHARDAAKSSDAINKLAELSKNKFSDLEDAYRAAATKGLASSFQRKAIDLGWSVRAWVSILIVNLAVGAGIGYLRFEELQKILTSPQPAPVIWGNLVFSILSIAPSVWLGWVATKQINQRFRLAEDYSFKATVASAYEAWKTEAQKQDKAFEQRLFGSALSRLEEAPLRFVENDNYGSPWHEFVSSPSFAKAIDAFPDFKAAFSKFGASGDAASTAVGRVLTALGGSSGDGKGGNGAS